jgi:hypothetical protein
MDLRHHVLQSEWIATGITFLDLDIHGTGYLRIKQSRSTYKVKINLKGTIARRYCDSEANNTLVRRIAVFALIAIILVSIPDQKSRAY